MIVRSTVVALLFAVLAAAPPPAGAERLAVHTYTVADGLAGDQVTAIVQDRQGFLWIGTNIGLFRLLPSGELIRCDVENGGLLWRLFALTRDSTGRIWVTGRGVAVFKPQDPLVEPVQRVSSSVVHLDFGTTQKLPENPGEALRIDHAVEFTKEKVFGIDEAPDGSLWLASYGGLAILNANGITWHNRRTGLVDATSDMAWALDPRHDSMAALVARVRRTASDVAEGFGAKFTLATDPLDGDVDSPRDGRGIDVRPLSSARSPINSGSVERLRTAAEREGSTG